MTNPFDDPTATFVLLENAAGDRSLWPADHPEPVGWRRRAGPASREACLAAASRPFSSS